MTSSRIATGRAINERVEADERDMTKNGNFCVEEDAGNGHWASSEDTDVAGVDAEVLPSRSSSESIAEEMVSVLSKDRLLILLPRDTDPDADDPFVSELKDALWWVETFFSILAGWLLSEEVEDMVVEREGARCCWGWDLGEVGTKEGGSLDWDLVRCWEPKKGGILVLMCTA
jgi:hypothetical protein